VEPAHLITQLRQHMARLRPIPATRHASPGTFVYKNLLNCTHVFLRRDSTRRGLEERQNAKTPCALRTYYRVCRQGQPCLHIKRERLRTHYIQTYDHRNPSHNTSWNTPTVFNDQDYTLRVPCPFSFTLLLLSVIPCRRGQYYWDSYYTVDLLKKNILTIKHYKLSHKTCDYAKLYES
jgi:hypothetical protein